MVLASELKLIPSLPSFNQANTFLCGEQLLRGETEETLEKLQAVMKRVNCFKKTFHTYRDKVVTWASSRGIHKCWDFPSALVFSRFDCFTARVSHLEVGLVSGFGIL